MELKELKKKYADLSKKYDLPDFDKLNLDFEIDKLDRDSDMLLRVVRKMMMEKLVNSVNFLEMLLNPGNSPRMYLPYIKSMSVVDLNLIDDLYTKLSKLTLSSLELEIESSEVKEAELIKKSFDEWNFLKTDFKKLIGSIRKPRTVVGKKERSYFG